MGRSLFPLVYPYSTYVERGPIAYLDVNVLFRSLMYVYASVSTCTLGMDYKYCIL